MKRAPVVVVELLEPSQVDVPAWVRGYLRAVLELEGVAIPLDSEPTREAS